MSERHLIASFIANRDAYSKVAEHIDPNALTEQGKLIVKHVGEYYDRDPDAQFVDPELLTGAVTRSLGNPKHQATFADLIKDLSSLEVSPQNVVADYIAVNRAAVGAKLATMLASGRGIDEVRPVLEEYTAWTKTETVEEKEAAQILKGASVLELVSRRTQNGGLIKLLPTALNERLDGGLLRGHHVVVFARPEVGKTAFVVNAIDGFCQQALRTLYIGNEDPIDDIVLRLVGRMSDMTKHEVIDDPIRADTVARQRGYDNVVLASLAPGTTAEIEELVKEYKPDVLVVDQLRNVNIGKEDNFTRKLEIAAQQVRAIGKRNNALVISITQAGDSASGKSILDMGDVDSSNTGIPAQADVMVGIGMSMEDEHMGRRVLSLPKNKAGGTHHYFPVMIDVQKSRLRSE